MFTLRNVKSAHLGLVSALVLYSLAGTASAQSQPQPHAGGGMDGMDGMHGMQGMTTQLAELGGAMAATVKACGGYSEAQIQESKQKQQELLSQQGMDAETFEKTYQAAKAKAESGWKALSKAEQDEACQEVKQLGTLAQ